ncbi:MAG TPA: DUF1275 domain-containing transporter [Polyangiaceae bacterium]|nr:DUF1275 domain-containing transporter [Polyangiaceae bacterium]
MPAPALFRTDDEIFAPRPLLGWLGFSLTAGWVNASAFLACRNFISHVTGMVTSLALDLPRLTLALESVLVLGAFLSGAAIAVLAAETWRARRRMAFALPLWLALALLVGVALAGRAGLFGEFGSSTSEEAAQVSLAMLGALAAAMGLLNASVALATANAIRSTHLTGPATDLAGNLVRAALGSDEASSRELRWASLRAAKLVAFATGGVVAAACAERLRYDLFLLAAVALAAALGLTAAPPTSHAPPRGPGGAALTVKPRPTARSPGAATR